MFALPDPYWIISDSTAARVYIRKIGMVVVEDVIEVDKAAET